ncbi:hypothetical protein [Streptomyces guryensis]|uniref:Uncharacterized protein n=1 Tax=Streptomyces guryensis TaxID=2886947 RepID=A0A9Q3VY78_9ACTN|nr:hypothetical protein [Streptomyces guryensis]MCD9879145.1 hypothetical protein [Streptomyces guryensis]
MTQQYLVGEASVLLSELQASGTDPLAVRELARLRHEAETGPVSELGSVALRALELTDHLCRQSLQRGDVPHFVRQCAGAAELREFCLCAQLLAEHDPSGAERRMSERLQRLSRAYPGPTIEEFFNWLVAVIST